MALTKLIAIDNLGRFLKYRASGDVGFSELTLIYGDNGSGKTTLTALIGSLASGDASPIAERATLGVEEPPRVEIRSSSGNHTFAKGAWSATHPLVEVFDESFVRDNVYAGDVVGIEQRRNLYQVVVGPAAVAKAQRIAELDSEGRVLAREVAQAEAVVRSKMQSPFELDEFLELEAQNDLGPEIARLTRELSAARNAKEVASRPSLLEYELPDSPRGLLGILGETIEGLSMEAERRVREHIAGHPDGHGEEWIRQGLSYVGEANRCPFCSQGLDDVTLIADFAAFFSAAYREHIVAIRRSISALDERFGPERIGRIANTSAENRGRLELWEELLDLGDVVFDGEAFRSAAASVHTELLAHFEAKLRNPTEIAAASGELESAVRDFDSAREQLSQLNERIALANQQIAQFKTRAATADQARIEAQLRRLRNIQIRHSAEVAGDVEALIRVRKRKRASDEEKGTLREELREEAETLLASYESDINSYLASFGASFRIVKVGPSFAGGRASSTYRLVLNDVELELGNAETPRGTPCFRTALSAGDKSTLALAFFLARLDRKSDLSATAVVFDDPLTSLDAFRTSFTQQTLVELVRRAAQVVVLSHDPFFLKGIDDYFDGTGKTLRLGWADGSARLIAWNIDDHCLAQAHRDYFVLRRFLEEGTADASALVTVARAIRPYLEGYLRNRFPSRFPRGSTFGAFIREIREAPVDDALRTLQPRADDLDQLNTFTRRFHHSDAGGPPSTTTEAELRTWAQRAIAFVQAG